MSLQISLPLGKKEGVKNLVFTILTREYPLKLIELTNFIRKRYGKAVTFQAVRKAVLELIEEQVLIRDNNEFSINKEWVKESVEYIGEEKTSYLYKVSSKPHLFLITGVEGSLVIPPDEKTERIDLTGGAVADSDKEGNSKSYAWIITILVIGAIVAIVFVFRKDGKGEEGFKSHDSESIISNMKRSGLNISEEEIRRNKEQLDRELRGF